DMDIMLRCLRVPVEKLSWSEISSLKERITWLSREAGYRPPREKIIENILDGFKKTLGIDYYFSKLLPAEEEKLGEKLNYFKSGEHIYRTREKESQFYVNSIVKSKKKVIKCSANIDVKRSILKNLYFTGDFFLYPRRAVFDLEAVLKNIPVHSGGVRKIVESFFRSYPQKISGIGIREIVRAVEDCFAKAALGKYGIPKRYFNDIYLIHSGFCPHKRIEVLLMPYCAKLPRCKYRYSQGCSLCGRCSIRQAEEIAKKYRVKTCTIVSFEHLMGTLRRLRREGVNYYAGCCCEAFYQKHQQDFESVALPGILLNIENTTCYDLGREEDAYRGRFEGFTNIKADLLQRILTLTA
ncbi:MAG: DUF116 domain-containing protein, partial [Actinomycetota bacterium]